jgi:hypothetical protein
VHRAYAALLTGVQRQDTRADQLTTTPASQLKAGMLTTRCFAPRHYEVALAYLRARTRQRQNIIVSWAVD